MIHEISSDLRTFKSVKLNAGLNIILADKSSGASDKQSRNGAGKSSLIEIIHFLFGGNAKADSIFRNEPLVENDFSLTFDLNGEQLTATRSGNQPSKITISGNTEAWPIKPKFIEKTGDYLISNENWKLLLGAAFFNLPHASIGKYHPTFRSLFSYFVRRQRSGAFQNALQQSTKQQLYDQQIAISKLLNLDFLIPRSFQELRDKEKAVATLRKAAKGGALGKYIKTAAELRTELAIESAKLERMEERVAEFRVVEEYAEYEKEASRLTREISQLNNNNTVDRELIQQLQETLASERAPAAKNLKKLYSNAGVLLPDLVQQRFEDVQAFHEKVIENRKQHLGVELSAAEARINERSETRAELDLRRMKVMQILSSGGALEHYTALRESAANVEASVAILSDQLKAAETLESTKAEIETERTKLLTSLQSDYQERADYLAEAVIAFEDISNALYETGGRLTVSPTKNGPDINLDLEAERSKGIGNMKIFCFDLIMMDLNSRRKTGPGFLVHDSHLFDGVDERQVAKALQLGASHATKHNYQYIVTMNSDVLPKDGFVDGFDITRYINRTKLTDDEVSGGLFGVKF